jgi:flavin-dependent dehydrogenase
MAHETHDVAVIGAGNNGLTCAAYLAGAGLRVLEKNAVAGGAVLTPEVPSTLSRLGRGLHGERDPHSGSTMIGCPGPPQEPGHF